MDPVEEQIMRFAHETLKLPANVGLEFVIVVFPVIEKFDESVKVPLVGNATLHAKEPPALVSSVTFPVNWIVPEPLIVPAVNVKVLLA